MKSTYRPTPNPRSRSHRNRKTDISALIGVQSERGDLMSVSTPRSAPAHTTLVRTVANCAAPGVCRSRLQLSSCLKMSNRFCYALRALPSHRDVPIGPGEKCFLARDSARILRFVNGPKTVAGKTTTRYREVGGHVQDEEHQRDEHSETIPLNGRSLSPGILRPREIRTATRGDLVKSRVDSEE